MRALLVLFVSLWALASLSAVQAQVDGCQFWKKIGYNNVFTCPNLNFGTFKKFKSVKAASWQACAQACAKLDSKGCRAYSFNAKNKGCMVSFAAPSLGSLKGASGMTAGYLVDSEDK